MSTITPDRVLQILSRHQGAEEGVSARHLALALGGEHDTVAGAERQVRNAIVELRRAGHHVCAHPTTGYFIAVTEEELTRTCEYLHSRAMCSLEQVAAMRNVSLPDLRGQLRLPT